jgi:hypothetical protein
MDTMRQLAHRVPGIAASVAEGWLVAFNDRRLILAVFASKLTPFRQLI